MKPFFVGAVILFTAAPAIAQSRVYTNRDLGQRPVTWTRTVTPEELASVASRQFRLPAQFDGPTVIIIGQRVEPQPLPPYRPLSEPWSMTTYVGWSHGRSLRAGLYAPRPGIHLRYP